MEITLPVVLGLISALIGILVLIYSLGTSIRLRGGCKRGFLALFVGLLFGFLIILTNLAFELSLLAHETEEIAIPTLLILAAISFLYGMIQINGVLKFVPPTFFEKINQFKR